MNAVNAADEGLFAGGVARFVAAEDLGDVAELLDAIDDRAFVEGMGGEIVASALDVVIDGEETDIAGAGIFGGAGETGFGDEERTEAIPVAVAGRARDYVVNGEQDAVDGFHVGGFGRRNAGGEILRRRDWSWLRR